MRLLGWLRRSWSLPAESDPPTVSTTDSGAPSSGDAWNVLTNVNEWVKHAEAKLGVILAFLGVLAAGLISLVIEVGRGSVIMMALEGASGGALLLAIGCASLGLLPQFDHEADEARLNPLFYGDVRQYFATKPDDYTARLSAALSDPETITAHLARQIVANSGVAVRKYTWANRAVILGLVSLLGTVAVAVGLALCW